MEELKRIINYKETKFSKKFEMKLLKEKELDFELFEKSFREFSFIDKCGIYTGINNLCQIPYIKYIEDMNEKNQELSKFFQYPNKPYLGNDLLFNLINQFKYISAYEIFTKYNLVKRSEMFFK